MSTPPEGTPQGTPNGTPSGTPSGNPSDLSSKTPPSDAKPEKPRRKIVFKNPALRAMGLTQFTLPSRNWVIFFTVVALIGGAIYYDKSEQKRIRKTVCDDLHPLGERVYPTQELPRKLTIYIAPPPNDFLDESVKLFRKFIKPYLNAAAIDFEIFSETRQGDIRATVAQQIRDLRQAQIDQKISEYQQLQQKKQAALWLARISKEWGKVKLVFSKTEDVEDIKAKQDLYSAKDVMGLYKITNPVQVVSEDAIDPVHGGGVLCIGRGAYKEYLQGVHEGLLGPLEKPQWLIEQENQEKEEKRVAKWKEEAKDKKPAEGEVIPTEPPADWQPVKDEDEREPVTKPYIKAEDYAKAPLAPELDMTQPIFNDNGVPVVFEQPVYVIPVYNLHGFKNVPRNLYGWFTKRTVAADMAERTLVVVNNEPRPFQFKDTLAAGDEEWDWPKKWIEKGKEKGSEWVQELVTDDRVTLRMRTYVSDKQL